MRLRKRVEKIERDLSAVEGIGANIGEHLNHGARISQLESASIAREEEIKKLQIQLYHLTQAVTSLL